MAGPWYFPLEHAGTLAAEPAGSRWAGSGPRRPPSLAAARRRRAHLARERARAARAGPRAPAVVWRSRAPGPRLLVDFAYFGWTLTHQTPAPLPECQGPPREAPAREGAGINEQSAADWRGAHPGERDAGRPDAVRQTGASVRPYQARRSSQSTRRCRDGDTGTGVPGQEWIRRAGEAEPARRLARSQDAVRRRGDPITVLRAHITRSFRRGYEWPGCCSGALPRSPHTHLTEPRAERTARCERFAEQAGASGIIRPLRHPRPPLAPRDTLPRVSLRARLSSVHARSPPSPSRASSDGCQKTTAPRPPRSPLPARPGPRRAPIPPSAARPIRRPQAGWSRATRWSPEDGGYRRARRVHALQRQQGRRARGGRGAAGRRCDPPPADPAVTAGSTLTEATASPKAGAGDRRLGFNPGNRPLDRVRVDSERTAADHQPGRARRRQPELPQGRPARADAARRLHPPREDHALRSRAHSRARRACARLGRARLLRVLRSRSTSSRARRIFAEAGKRTPVFVRFSTVAGERGSTDTRARRARLRGEVLHR